FVFSLHGNQFLNIGVNSPPLATMVKVIQLGEGEARGASCPPCKASELESVNERGTRYRCPPF
ncbi:MAG: hypothetical protein PUG85_03860, partial [Oscillospiraceae bacterium]|nr:hypothetical protein [Oscillospiraceae bacterium]